MIHNLYNKNSPILQQVYFYLFSISVIVGMEYSLIFAIVFDKTNTDQKESSIAQPILPPEEGLQNWKTLIL